ncbi:hypothetical protein TNCV_2177271 [Trichonephila clavipes]|uniref:Reverse transcriptase n=1 Tax=Trichonephila clavipes TaxID=2585209 RepID=A0A8X6VU30_TRICX|nr:hypothetical protein TNCV_2177271 [Trichonephila clavipes]
MDTEDNPPVVSRPYRYGRVKQMMIYYLAHKMLKEGTIIPTQSPYTSPVVLCKRNNGLPPSNERIPYSDNVASRSQIRLLSNGSKP